MGDSSDNIPGVPKVGEKTAISLIQDYGSVDGVYAHIDEIKSLPCTGILLKTRTKPA